MRIAGVSINRPASDKTPLQAHLPMPRLSELATRDMVDSLHEVTRNQTPTSERIDAWARKNKLPVLPTKTYQYHQ